MRWLDIYISKQLLSKGHLNRLLRLQYNQFHKISILNNIKKKLTNKQENTSQQVTQNQANKQEYKQ